jgi:hypothetical protein
MRSIVVLGGFNIEGVIHVHDEDYESIIVDLTVGRDVLTLQTLLLRVSKYNIRYEPFPKNVYIKSEVAK